jgi:hypothetical protein
MALQKATTAAKRPAVKKAADKPRVKRAPKKTEVVEEIFTMKDLVGQDLKERVFQVVPGQDASVQKIPWWGGVRNPSNAFVVTMLKKIPYAGLDKSLWHFDGIDDLQGPLNCYVHPDLKIKELKEKTAALEEMARLQGVTVRGYEMFPNSYHYSIGADPEIFAVNGKGELLPAFEFLKSKEEASKSVYPKPAPNRYWDGYQAEFTVDPGECMAHFVDRIQYQLRDMLKDVRAVDKDGNLTLKNTFDIPLERLVKDSPEYVAFGCHPSKNAYDEPAVKVEGKNVPFRSAGGHLHFTIMAAPDKKKVVEIVKELDRVLGVISVSMFQYYDDPRRRMFYGKAGEYRTPAHGLEYRVLSNAWMCHPAITHFVYELARKVIWNAINKKVMPYWDITEDEARTCINTCDVGMAKALLKRNALGLDGILASFPGMNIVSPSLMKTWRGIVMDGVHNYLSNPDRLSIAWRLEGNATTWIGHSEGECGNIYHTCNYLREKEGNILDWE